MIYINIESMTTVKTQIVFPVEVLRELDGFVEERKRSEFVVEAVQEKLRRLRLEESLARRRMKRLQRVWKSG